MCRALPGRMTCGQYSHSIFNSLIIRMISLILSSIQKLSHLTPIWIQVIFGEEI